MPLYGSGDDEERWGIRGAPQCSTDILLQVVDYNKNKEDNTLFAFNLYEQLSEIIDDHVGIDGTVILTPSKKVVFTRWADVLDRCASMIRSVVETAITEKTTSESVQETI